MRLLQGGPGPTARGSRHPVRNLEGLAGDLVQTFSRQQVLGAKQFHELPGIHFRHQNLIVARQQILQVPGQRPDIAQMDMADIETVSPRDGNRTADRPIGRAPTDDRKPALVSAQIDGLFGGTS